MLLLPPRVYGHKLMPLPIIAQYMRCHHPMIITLIATACSNPPEGRVRWTMQLLADHLVNVGIIDSISDETVRQTLKKMKLSLG